MLKNEHCVLFFNLLPLLQVLYHPMSLQTIVNRLDVSSVHNLNLFVIVSLIFKIYL